MDIEEELIKILAEEDTEKLRRYVMAILRPEKIDLISEEDFSKYFIITESIRTLAKVLTAMCKLGESVKIILSGERGVGKTTSLRYIYHVLKKHLRIAIVEILEQLNGAIDKDCAFIIDNEEMNLGTLTKISNRADSKTLCIELRPYWVLQGLETGFFNDKWQIIILLPPKESEIRDIVRKRFGDTSHVLKNPLLTLLSQIKSSRELGLHLYDVVRKQKGTKQKILWALTSNENGLFVKEIAKIVNRSPATISRHLKELEEEKLIRAERIGKRIFYRISSVGVRVFTEETIIDEILRKWGSKVFAI